MEQASVVRASLAVAAAALLEAVLGPYLTFGWISPKLMVLGVVFAVAPLRDLQAVLLGFFGGTLFDALGGGLFGVGALSGLLAGILSARAGDVRPKGAERLLLAQVVAISVAAYDLTYLTALNFAGLQAPRFGEYAVAGVIPDALLNALLAYFVGGWLLHVGREKTGAWDER
ncbi:MAG TPA: rod shape-determining protein MreD [Rubrobacteraceae bacterium]|jgi:rod shape-determining protein MreD|nr:rod shape-determining protein MreD [Rubrobacteraceae bacterium]